jgi:hypothetical protein
VAPCAHPTKNPFRPCSAFGYSHPRAISLAQNTSTPSEVATSSQSVSNLTNKVYYSTIRNLLPTYDVIEGQPGPPREYLVWVRKSF